MKKLSLLFLALAISGCAPVFQSERPTERSEHLRGTPRYGANDTVRNLKTGLVFVIDSIESRKNSKQVFYACHDLNGRTWNWLPENSIVKM